MNKNCKKVIVSLIFGLSVLVFCGCGNSAKDNTQASGKSKKISIAWQKNIGYVPLIVMKEFNYLEEENSDVEVNWVELVNGAAVNEALASGRIDIGTMGVPVALTGIGAGCNYKIAFGVSSQPYSILTNDVSIKSIKDIKKTDQIAINTLNGQSHILLAMACKKILGDAHALDSNLITLSNADGHTSMLSKAIKTHMVISPFNFMELKDKDVHEIKISEDIWNPKDSTIVGVAVDTLKEKNPDLYDSFIGSLKKAMNYIKENPDDTAEILTKYIDADAKEIKEWLLDYRSSYDYEVHGIMKIANFMKDEKFIDKSPSTISDIVYDNVIGD